MRKFLFALMFVCVFSSYAQKVTNQEIADMMVICNELNPSDNPGLIHEGEWLELRFPDNKGFKFYQPVKTGESRWSIVKHQIEVTKMYRPVYWSHAPIPLDSLNKTSEENLKQPTPDPLPRKEPEKDYSLALFLFFLIIAYILIHPNKK